MTPKQPDAPAWGRRFGRHALRVLRGVSAALVIVFLAAWYVLETDWTAERVREFIEARGAAFVGRPITIGHLEIDALPPRIDLDTVVVGDPARPSFAADRALLELGAVELLAGRLAIENLELDAPRLNLDPLPGLGTGEDAPAVDLTIRRLRIADGAVRWAGGEIPVAGDVAGVQLALDPDGFGRLGLGTGRGRGEFRVNTGALDFGERGSGGVVMTPLRLAAVYSTRPRVLQLEDAEISLAGNAVRGRGTVRSTGSMDLDIEGDVEIADVLRIWPVPGTPDHAGRVAFAGSLQVRNGAPVLAGRLRSRDSRFAGLDLETLQADLQARRGLFALRNLTGRVYGGEITGEFLVETGETTTSFSARYSAAGMDAAPFTAWSPLGSVRLAGSLDGSGELTWQTPFSDTATGAGSLQVRVADVNRAIAGPGRTRNQVLAEGQQARAPSLPLPGAARLDYEFRDGTVRVSDLSADLAGTRVQGSGSIAPNGSIEGGLRLESEDLRIVDIAIAQARQLAGQGGARLGIRGTGDLELRLTGTTAAPQLSGTVGGESLAIADLRLGDFDAIVETVDGFLETRDLRVRRDGGTATGIARIRLSEDGQADADYDVRLRLDRYPTSADLQFAGPEWPTYATLSGDVALRGRYDQPLTGSAQLAGTSVTIAGAAFDSVTLRGRKAEAAWIVDRLRLGTADGELTASMLYGPQERQLSLDAEFDRFAPRPVAAFLDLPDTIGGEVNGILQLDGAVDALSGRADLVWTDASMSGLRLGSVRAVLDADRGTMSSTVTGGTPDDGPDAAESGWIARATVQTRSPYPTRAQIEADARVASVLIAPLGLALPPDARIAGRADLDLAGNLRDPETIAGTGTIEALAVRRGDFEARSQFISVAVSESVVELNGRLETEAGTVIVAPALDLGAGTVHGEISGRLPANIFQLADPNVSATGTFDIDLRLRGTVEHPSVDGTVVATALLVDGDWPYPVRVDTARLNAAAGQVVLDEFAGMLGDTPLELAAEFVLGNHRAAPQPRGRVEVAVSGLPLDPVLESTPGAQRLVNGGSVDLRINAVGDSLDPLAWTGTLEVDALDIRMQQYRARLSAPVSARMDSGRLTLPDTVRFAGDGTDLSVHGTIDFADSTIDLSAQGSVGFEALNVLSPYWGTGGLAVIDVRARGASDDPSYEGFATMRDVVLSPPVIRQPVEDVSARLDFDGRRVTVSDVRGALGGGEVRGGGEIFLRNNFPQSFRLEVQVDNSVIRLERDVRFTASADLVHDGTPERSLLSGNVDLVETQYRREYETDRALLDLLDAPETEPNPFLESINLALNVRGDEELFVDNNLADIESSADFDIRGTVARPVVLGRASILSGRLFWNGNNFDVLQGIVEFNNPFETEATFEIRARTEIRRYTIDMRFSGSLRRGVDFDYTSTPTLSDLELFNLLAFGEEPDSTTVQDPDRYQQALGLQATRYLTDAYFSEVESGARRLFGVDRFRISPTISGSETDATARVTLGKRINRNVYLTYSRLLSTSEDQLITVEYQVSPRLRIKGTRDEDGSFGIDFLVQQRIRR